jgi:hypothetical protein
LRSRRAQHPCSLPNLFPVERQQLSDLKSKLAKLLARLVVKIMKSAKLRISAPFKVLSEARCRTALQASSWSANFTPFDSTCFCTASVKMGVLMYLYLNIQKLQIIANLNAVKLLGGQ